MKYGWRARIGQIRPASSIEGNEEWRSVAPEGVAFIDARTIVPEVTEQGLEVMMSQVLRATREIACAKPDVVMQCRAPGIFLKGKAYEAELIAQMEEIAQAPCTTMMTAMVDGMRAVGMRRAAIGTIYIDELNVALTRHLNGEGFEVGTIKGLQHRRIGEIMNHEPDVAYRLGKELFEATPGADGIVLSCGGWRTFEIIDMLERDTGVPVITSNQAALWKALRMVNIPERIPGLGKLFREG